MEEEELEEMVTDDELEDVPPAVAMMYPTPLI